MNDHLLPAVSGLVASAGGAMVLSNETLIPIGAYGLGIAAVVRAAFWLGGVVRANTLEQQATRAQLQRGEERFGKLEKACELTNRRMDRLERHCIVVHAQSISDTQRINPTGDLEP